jgi:hypothetical protein
MATLKNDYKLEVDSYNGKGYDLSIVLNKIQEELIKIKNDQSKNYYK